MCTKEEMKTLHHKRGQIKGLLTRFNNFIESIDLQKVDTVMIKLKLEKIEPVWEKFDEVQTEIELIDPENGSELDIREKFEEQYFEIINKARKLLSQPIASSPNGREISENDHLSISSAHDVEGHCEGGIVKLPMIELPCFSGNWEEFRSFKEEFDSLIDTRSDLAPVQKFRYLIRSLKGDAALAIKAMDVTNENYKEAWEELEQRFDNKRLTVSKHVKAILDCEKIDKCTYQNIQCLVNVVSSHLRSLKSLGLPTDQWDALLVQIIVKKLDRGTRQRWEQVGDKNELPTISQLLTFLQERVRVLAALEEEKAVNSSQVKHVSGNSKNYHVKVNEDVHAVSPQTQHSIKCFYCGQLHKIYSCRLFRALSVANRMKEIKKLGVCENCFQKGHTQDKCFGLKCRICSKPHNTLLHQKDVTCEKGSTNTDSKNSSEDVEAYVSRSAFSRNSANPKPVVLLSTAIVHVISQEGNILECRVLLDSGSQSNFVTQRVVKHLTLTSTDRHTTVSEKALHTVTCRIKSRYGDWDRKLEFLILPEITLPLPEVKIDISSWKIPSNIFLADPVFYKPGQIDMLIGAEEFFNLIREQQISLGDGLPRLHHTRLGWIMVGKVNKPRESNKCNEVTQCGCCVTEQLMRKFWEVEEISKGQVLTPEEKKCEKFFEQTTKRDTSGRFVVNLPLKENVSKLGESESAARDRFYSLEKRLNKNQELKENYSAFMKEYLDLGHMKLAAEDKESVVPEYYLPHHCVINSHSSTTKLRVVFDASARTSSGISLNEVLMVGPKIQEDLFSIVLRFRQHKYVITADITKMYRQIRVCDQHLNLQKVFWRDDPSKPLMKYHLTTVTYGTAPASYLATRCLQQALLEEQLNHPIAVEAALRDFYMDDLLTGADELGKLKVIRKEISEILFKAKFELHKWCANDKSLLTTIPIEKRERKYVPDQACSSIKTLGLWWNPEVDSFKFFINVPASYRITKRTVLSEAARIFDPLGLVGPVIVKAKIFLQDLWATKIEWDDELTEVQRQDWLRFRTELSKLEDIVIPRAIRSSWTGDLELHGFSDASEKAYGAAVYIREAQGECRLLCAKSRVAPLKKLSLPRLELCGALILARLVYKVQDALRLKFKFKFLWCDSTILLAWLKSPSSRWKTFVANRVSEVQELTAGFEWRHINSADNPADKVSRGMYPSEILNNALWWHGPCWIGNKERWPAPPMLEDTSSEQRSPVTLVATVKGELIDWERYSSFLKLVRAVVYVRRFIQKCRKQKCTLHAISCSEWMTAETMIIRLVQMEGFAEDLDSLSNQKMVSKKSKLRNLSPFLDEEGLIRVGGRIGTALFVSYNQKYPYLLPDKHPVTNLIFKWEHVRHLHAGPQLLLANIRQKYWPINGRNLARKMVHACITCFRNKPKNATQLMGELPPERVQLTKTFFNTGVDYCGPISIKMHNYRNAKITKAYIAVFVCLAVKAVHIELVSDLTTETFLGALKRFFARRGKAKCMFSDNGRNFVGAERELRKQFQQISRDARIYAYLAQENVEWRFIPPHAPQFGGLWEAAVKSLKFHFKRVVGQAVLTYEEMSTYLALIESCLNSRPLCPLSSDPNDLSPLTPGHFLTGDSLSTIPQRETTDLKISTLSRWHRIEHMFQCFWVRWSREYLSLLQGRKKWLRAERNLEVGQLVLVKDEGLPPLKWPLGRIIATHPGRDNLIRVVTLKTASGVLKRPIAKVCPLPEDKPDGVST